MVESSLEALAKISVPFLVELWLFVVVFVFVCGLLLIVKRCAIQVFGVSGRLKKYWGLGATLWRRELSF